MRAGVRLKLIASTCCLVEVHTSAIRDSAPTAGLRASHMRSGSKDDRVRTCLKRSIERSSVGITLGKTRVHDLAKTLKISSAELLEMLKELGIDASSHSATLEDSECDRIRISMAGRLKRDRKPKRVVRKRRPESAVAEGEAKTVKRVRKRPTSEEPDVEVDPGARARAKAAKAAAAKGVKPKGAAAKSKVAKPKTPTKTAAAKAAAAARAAGAESAERETAAKRVPPKKAATDKDAAKTKLDKRATKAEGSGTEKTAKAAKAPTKKPAPAPDAVTKSEEPEKTSEKPAAETVEKGAPDSDDSTKVKRARSADKTGGKGTRRAGILGAPATDQTRSTAPTAPAQSKTGVAPSQPKPPHHELEFPEPPSAVLEDLVKEDESEVEIQPPRERQARQLEAPEGPAVAAVTVRRGVTIQEFAALIGMSATDIVKRLMALGEMKTVTMSLTDEEVELLGAELGVETSITSPDAMREAEDASLADDEAVEDEGKLRPRPPVVTVMGHVDHGKTLLLDRIREADVVSGEAGGITQHIGAYMIHHNGKAITFIDTPGHEAFTRMRARGASITDIAVLVVAADDGVMPQTVEAISHIRAAEVQMMVAINKIDRPNSDPQKVRAQLTEHGVIVEDFGGEVPVVEISALERIGIDDLLEMILLMADIAELKANPDTSASGVCLEANLDVGRGAVATVLLRRGTLQKGDAFYAGSTFGRVRALLDENGNQLDRAGPSTPVQVLGFESVPEAGDDFRVVADEKRAREVASGREQALRQAEQVMTPAVARLEDLFARIQDEDQATLNLILKADVQGSLEALAGSLRKLERPDVHLQIVHAAVGGITANDISLAVASGALVVGFNVRPDRKSRELAQRTGVEIRTYEVIYKAVEEIDAALKGMLAPEYEEVVTGSAEVRAVFKVPRIGNIAGCYVTEGQVTRGSSARLLRDGAIVYSGAVSSLRRFKDDVREVQSGYECGIGLEDYGDIKEGDVIELFEQREIPRI